MATTAGNPARTRDEDAIGTPPDDPTLVPAERYYSPAFAALETQRMWPRVWQLACMVDHVAVPGDYFEYRCGPYGVLIVRDDDGALRAFQNVCRHRGNSLCTGSGSGLRELKCGYHGWTWDLAGALKRVPNRKGFGSLRMSDFPLIPARVDTWAGLVFVNLDPGAVSLTEYLEAVPSPDKGELIMFLMTRMPPGAPSTKPTDVRMAADAAEPGSGPGIVLTQDIAVLPGLQRGMHQPGFTHMVLSSEERRVINMHRNLERYLELPTSQQMSGGAST